MPTIHKLMRVPHQKPGINFRFPISDFRFQINKDFCPVSVARAVSVARGAMWRNLHNRLLPPELPFAPRRVTKQPPGAHRDGTACYCRVIRGSLPTLLPPCCWREGSSPPARPNRVRCWRPFTVWRPPFAHRTRRTPCQERPRRARSSPGSMMRTSCGSARNMVRRRRSRTVATCASSSERHRRDRARVAAVCTAAGATAKWRETDHVLQARHYLSTPRITHASRRRNLCKRFLRSSMT